MSTSESSNSPTVAKLRQALVLLAMDKEAGTNLLKEVAGKIEALENQVSEMSGFINTVDIALRQLIIPSLDTYQQPVASPVVTSQPAKSPPRSGNGDLFFNCQEMLPMTKSKTDPSPIWKIQGDKSQYPVAFYDLENQSAERLNEQRSLLLENGIDALQMYVNNKPVKHNLTGWRAYYEPNTDNNFPKKVVKLVKVG